ncbi:hypothetical protein XENOCAPTIV_008646, partial [Xenoophorus captivus]
ENIGCPFATQEESGFEDELPAFSFLSFDPIMVAEQFTLMDARDKKGKEHLAPTIRATVAQFNSVTNCVITTCLSNPTLKPNQRARLIERWIDVAREGTSKFATLEINPKRAQRRHQQQRDLELRDVVFSDIADVFQGGLINFEKRRKEFEVIAQIKLLQLASNNYSFTQESHFREWFAAVEKLSEAERYPGKQKILTACIHFFISF